MKISFLINLKLWIVFWIFFLLLLKMLIKNYKHLLLTNFIRKIYLDDQEIYWNVYYHILSDFLLFSSSTLTVFIIPTILFKNTIKSVCNLLKTNSVLSSFNSHILLCSNSFSFFSNMTSRDRYRTNMNMSMKHGLACIFTILYTQVVTVSSHWS